MKTIVIDGNNFNDLESFYDEVQRNFCPDLEGLGRNLDAFNDVLRGGFGVFEYGEPIALIWKNTRKSSKDLGYEATVSRLEKMQKSAHPSNFESIKTRLWNARKHEGFTLFDELVDIIEGQSDHIKLSLID